ncbi:MAG: DUF998 domain-containing protein [Gaiellaceae bacterium]
MIAAAASLVLTSLCLACLVCLHVAPTGYSPLRNAVSEYGVGRYARWYQAQAACAGAAAILLGVALRRPTQVVVLLVVFALARFAITRFPTDLLGVAQRTRTGTIHWLLAVVAFGAAASAAIRLKPAHHGLPALGWAMAVCAVGTGFATRSPRLRSWLGLIERGFYAALLAWLILVAARLL